MELASFTELLCRVAQAMGYIRVIAYTLTEEIGSSMKASTINFFINPFISSL